MLGFWVYFVEGIAVLFFPEGKQNTALLADLRVDGKGNFAARERIFTSPPPGRLPRLSLSGLV